jgi:hypothetical protein
MKFIPVDSAMILGVRYNEKSRDLEVIFRTGEKYRYKNVPPFEYEGLMNAKSQGQYMHKRILGRFDYEHMD